MKFNNFSMVGFSVQIKPLKFFTDRLPIRPKEPIKPELPYTKRIEKEFKVGEEEYKLSSLLKNLEGKDVSISAYEKGLDEGLVQFICLSYVEEIEVSDEDKKLFEKQMTYYNKDMELYQIQMKEYEENYKEIHNAIICYQIGLLFKKINQLKNELIK